MDQPYSVDTTQSDSPDQWLPVLLLLFVGSGCAALIYEIVWFQMLELFVGSSSVSIGVLLGTFMGGMCLGSFLLPRFISPRLHPLRVYALLEIAKNVEAQVIGVPTGLQDYRPALYGGIAALELGVEGATRVPLAVAPAALDDRLVVCYTGAPRASGINNWEITKRRIDGEMAKAVLPNS